MARIKRRHAGVLILCFVLLGVTMAQIWSNTLSWNITSSEPMWTLSFVSGPPDTMIIGSPVNITIQTDRTFSGDYEGYLNWTLTIGTGQVKIVAASMENYTISQGESCKFPFSMYDDVMTGTYSFLVTILSGTGSYVMDILLRGD